MGTQVVRHKSRDVDYLTNWGVGVDTPSSFKADSDGEVYADDLTNIDSYTVGGISISLPFPIVKDLEYSIGIVKTIPSQSASLLLKSRRQVNKLLEKNVPTLPPEASQGTKQYYLHPSDFICSVVDSSLNNDTNYLGGTSWTTNPIIAEVSLPNVTGGELWETCFFDYTTDRMILVGRDTLNPGRFILCALHISGVKENQIWNLDGDTQNTYDIINSQTMSSTIYPAVDFNNDKVVLQNDNRKYDGSLSDLKTWTFDDSKRSQLVLEVYLRKAQFNASTDSFVTFTCRQNLQTYERLDNYYRNTQRYGTSCDNINNNIYQSVDNINGIYVYNGNAQIATIGGAASYRSSLVIPASIKRRLLVTKNGTYIDQPTRASLIDLDTLTTIKNEQIFIDTDVTNCKDAEYINSIECYAAASDGIAGTQGRRLVYYLDANNNGVDSLLKYKVLLNYDCTYIATNRLRY